jgi:hypothetical protein
MKNIIIIKIGVIVMLLYVLIQNIYASKAQQDDGPVIKKELIIPAPALPTL